MSTLPLKPGSIFNGSQDHDRMETDNRHWMVHRGGVGWGLGAGLCWNDSTLDTPKTRRVLILFNLQKVKPKMRWSRLPLSTTILLIDCTVH